MCIRDSLYTDELIRLVFEVYYTRTGKWVKPVTEEGKAAVQQFREELAESRGLKKAVEN